jgi:cell shape-determining protein MreC
MMNSYRRHNLHTGGRTSTSRFLLWFTIVVVVLAFADVLLHGALRAPVRSALAPLSNVAARVGHAIGNVEFFSTRSALLGEIESLKQENERMKERDLLFSVVLDENKSLRALASLGDGGIIAPVYSSLRASPYGTFLIGAGKERGVRKGDIAVSETGFVLGIVTDVSAASATVTLLFAPGGSVDAVSGETNFALSGRGLGNAKAQVPREAPLSVRDAVFAPTLGESPIGVIGRIESASSSAYADVFVYVPTNLNTLRFITITPGTAL